MGDLRPWQTRTHCCGHIVANGVSWAAQTGKHLLRRQNVSGQNHKICVRSKCCTRRQTGKHLCRQQCVGNNVSSFARALKPELGREEQRKFEIENILLPLPATELEIWFVCSAHSPPLSFWQQHRDSSKINETVLQYQLECSDVAFKTLLFLSCVA